MAPPRIPRALLALLLLSQLAAGLQVTPNSPCALTCQDDPSFDVSAPKSSNTKNSDITCDNADLDGPAGVKWKSCMTCLQNSTFVQGPESDQMWFMFNMRYSLANCIFSYPNATGHGSTPCSTSMACGPLEASFESGLLDQKGMTAFSYCSVHDESVNGSPTDPATYDRCGSCMKAGGTTGYLANYIVALEGGCLQQPESGKIVTLNDTIFAQNPITIIDPLTLIQAPSQGSSLPGTTIAGIVGGALALLLILAAFLFICYRKRKNRRARADFEANRDSRLRHRRKSSVSFQCQTHAMSPRFWPGGDDATSFSEEMADSKRSAQQPTDLGRRSSLWKPHNSMSSFENTLDATSEKAWESRYQEKPAAAQFTRNDRPAAPQRGPVTNSVPMHNITTNVPAIPQSARMSPSSAAVYHSPADFGTPMSAASARSTTALLPSIRPYVPAEHGVHNSPTPHSASAFGSPMSGTTASPLLRNQGWADPRPPMQQPRSRLSTASNVAAPPPPPPPGPSTDMGIGIAIGSVPPPAVPWIRAPSKKAPNKQNNSVGAAKAHAEAWEVQTPFSVPPPPPPKR